MNSSNSDYHDYGYSDETPCHMARLILPHLTSLMGDLKPGMRLLDVGCGNGFIAGHFIKQGCQVVGIDLSETGIALARKSYPEGRFEVLAADSAVLENLGEKQFDFVISTEVVEHLYDPRSYIAGCYEALREGGTFICTTPYHGYLKNLALSLTNKWDHHADPLWDGGHIKLWSPRTLSMLLSQAGLRNLQFRGVGRLPYLWMTMLMSGTK